MSFSECFSDILNSDEMQGTKQYIQHANVSVFAHCCLVAIMCLRIAGKIKSVDKISLVRGALLHDFFLYDWHLKKLKYLHGYKHPKTAYLNSKRYFNINKIEADIIKKHMWPLTLFKIPRYRESWLVCLADKICSICETFRIFKYDDERARRLLEGTYENIRNF